MLLRRANSDLFLPSALFSSPACSRYLPRLVQDILGCIRMNDSPKSFDTQQSNHVRPVLAFARHRFRQIQKSTDIGIQSNVFAVEKVRRVSQCPDTIRSSKEDWMSVAFPFTNRLTTTQTLTPACHRST